MESENYSLFLLVGKSGSGKTSSLRNMPLEETVLINAEAKSMLPFKGAKRLYKHFIVNDITKFQRGLDVVLSDEKVKYVVIDSLTFLMSMYEIQVVNQAVNTMKAWGEYAVFYKEIIHKLKTSKKNVVVTVHPCETLDEATGIINQCASVKGSLRGMIEADFNVVIYTHIFNDEEGNLKYGFLTNKTKDTIGLSVKSPFGMFETSMLSDNDVMVIFNTLDKFQNE